MTCARRIVKSCLLAARLAAGIVAATRLIHTATTAPPVRPTSTLAATISVVIPARDELKRIGPLLDAVVGAPGVSQVIVVDDQSSDGTAELARSLGAMVIAGTPLPNGWAGKAWAVQQGIAAATSDWVVTFDADARPDPLLPTALVARAAGERLDLLTVGGRFECPTRPSRWLHASMLTTLVYRFGPPGSTAGRAQRTMANGQCMTVRREPFLDGGGMSTVAGEVVEDIALARSIAGGGGRVGFLDASQMLSVRMFEDFCDTWRGWGRSLALPGVEPQQRQLLDLGVIVLAQVLPIPRILTRRGDLLDGALGLVRIGTLVGTRRAYDRVDIAYWLSPLADPLAAVAIARGISRRGRQSWRGRAYF